MAVSVFEAITAFIERLFIGPVWPASLLVCLLLAYTVVALLGIFDLDFSGDGGVNTGEAEAVGDGGEGVGSDGVEADGGLLGGLGGMTVRWMNLDRLPLILWMSLFTIAFWAISYFLWYGYDSRRYEPTWIPSFLLGLRNLVLAVGVTKLFTEPLSRWFAPAPRYSPSTLIGEQCVVSTLEVNSQFGQARFKTDAAPLLLNIRTDGEHFAKGDPVQIIAFDADRRIYKVTAAPRKVSS